MKTLQKIGIFGGSFAPFHLGHLTIVKFFISQCKLDKCYLVPNKRSPFKPDADVLYTDDERLNIIKDNITDVPNLELCRYELDSNAEISYSIDTIKYFKELHNNTDIFLLIGYDVALHFDKWKKYEEILEIVKIVIAARGTKHNENNNQQLEKIFVPYEYILLEHPLVDISSTEIRSRYLESQN